MNGPEHYREAERLERVALRMVDESTPNTVAERTDHARLLLAGAQVHATLAQVAITAYAAGAMGGAGPIADEWRRAVS